MALSLCIYITIASNSCIKGFRKLAESATFSLNLLQHAVSAARFSAEAITFKYSYGQKAT